MTARHALALAVDIAACAALPMAIFGVALALSLEVDGWLALPVVLAGGAVALGAGFARARWYGRDGAE